MGSVITARRTLRRALAISLGFRRDTGLRAAMGKSEAALAAAFATLWRELGLEREGNRFGRCGSLLAY